jgi:inhibitor of KinA
MTPATTAERIMAPQADTLSETKRVYFLGDSCICWSLGNSISEALSDLVLRIYPTLSRQKQLGTLAIDDLVPSYNALAVYFDPTRQNVTALRKAIDTIVDNEINRASETNSEYDLIVHTLPTVYQGEDLPLVAQKNGLTVDQVIELHQKPRYKVAMVGFLPHFPYLIGLDPKLETPRLDSPRTKVPKGSVAIGGAQTGIYPRESPGGWNLIGTTDPVLLEPINPGDCIIFKQVDHL